VPHYLPVVYQTRVIYIYIYIYCASLSCLLCVLMTHVSFHVLSVSLCLCPPLCLSLSPSVPLSVSLRAHSDVLALPIFKQEDASLPEDSETKSLPFQYVLCAATSPAVKLHDETLTYLNQGEGGVRAGRPRACVRACVRARVCVWC